MRLRLVAATVALACGCAHSYTAVSYDVGRSASGTMEAMNVDPDRKSGSAALGFGARGAAMEVALHAQDVETTVDPWLAASVGLELKLFVLNKGPVQGFVHGGPMRAALVDSTTGDVTWGAGLDYGGGLSIGVGGYRVFADLRNEATFYGGTTMAGTAGETTIRTLGIGVQLGGG